MRTLRWLVAGILCLVAAPATSSAQEKEKEEGQDFMRDVLWAIFGPGWNVFANTGMTTDGRFLLQNSLGTSNGERALKSEDGFNVGIGAGVDILLRVGFRMSYTYTTSDLAFRTNNGDGSQDLDIEDVGKLRSHVFALEWMRYMLPPRAPITPYASAGFLGAWWNLDEESPLVVGAGGSTQFRLGAVGSVGLQLGLTDHWRARIEFASSSVRNPFTGRHSFVAFSGNTIEEPSRVGRSDFRLVGLYTFGKPEMPTVTANGGRKRRPR